MIATREVTKRFGAVVAVDHVNLDVRAGDRYGLLGPNGSGKTTLIRLILGLSFATAGEVDLLGERMPQAGKRVLGEVGALIEAPAGYPHLSGRTNLMLFDAAGGARGRRTRTDRVDEVLKRVGLGGVDGRPIRAYSLGMRQRLGIAAALLQRPRLLILDEPTNGLDPRGIRDIRDLLLELADSGVTLFVSSHLLSEVEHLCTRVGIMDAGRLVLQDDLATIAGPTGLISVRTTDAATTSTLLGARIEHRDGNDLLIRGDDVPGLNAELVGAGVAVSRIEAQHRTLESVVLDVTGFGSDRVDV